MLIRREDFERLVDEAWETIPQSFRDRFSNVAVFVEDEPQPEHLRAAGVPDGYTLLGLYQGQPLSKRGWGYSMAMPDRVTLFQGPIERSANSAREIPQIVYDTLWHELAHHLGMDEKQVRDAERRRRGGN
jgi:predicted Zn-dependent protease with MMP-like domain